MLPPWLRSSVATAVSSAAASSSREEAAVKVVKVFTILAPPAQPLLQRRNITTRASSSSHRRGVHLDTTSPSAGPAYEHWPPPSTSQHASSSSSTSHFTFPPASSSQRNRHLLRYLDEDVDVDGHFASFSTLEEQHHHHHQVPTAPRRSQQHHLDSLLDSDLVAHAEQMGRDQLPEEASKLLDYLCGDMRLQQSGGSYAHGGHAASARLLQTWRRGGDSVTRRRRAAQALLRGAAAADLTSDEGKEVAEGITTLLSPHEVLRVFSILEEERPHDPSRATTSSTQEDPPPPPPFSFLSPHSGQRLASKLLHSGHPTLFPVFVALFEDLQARSADEDAGQYPTTDIMIDAFLYALHPRVWGQQGGDSFARRAVNALLLQRQQQQQAGGKGAREMAQLRGAGKDTRAWSSALAADEASMGLTPPAGSKDALIFELFTRLLVVRLCLQEGRLDSKVIKEQVREIVAAPARHLRSSSSGDGHAEQAGLDVGTANATEKLSARYVVDTINNVLSHGHGSKSKLAVRLASDLASKHASLVAIRAASSAATASSHNNLIIEGEQDTLLEELCQRALDIKRPGSAIRALRAVKQASTSASAPSSFSLSTLLRPDTIISLISSYRLVERAGYAPAHLHELLGWDQTSSQAAVTEPLVLDLSPSLRPAMLRALAFARVKGPLAYLWMRWTDVGQDQPSVTASGGVLGAHTVAADTALMKLMVKTFAPARTALGVREAGRNSNGSYASQELLHPDEGQRSSVSLPLRSREDEMAFATHVLQAFHRARTSPAEEPLFSPNPSPTTTPSSDPDTTDPSPTPSSSSMEEVALSHPQLYDHYDLTTLSSAYLDLGREKAAFKLFGELLHRREVPDETDLLVLVYAVATRASRRQAGKDGAAGARKGVQEAYKLYERYCMTKPSPSSSKRRGEEPSPPAPAGVHKQLRPTPKLHATLLRLALRAGEFDIARHLALSARKLRFLGGGGGDSENVAGHGHGGGGGRGDSQTATTLLLASKAFSPMSFEQQLEGTVAGSSGGASSPHVRPVWHNLAKLAQSKVRDRSWQPDAELLQHFARAALRGQTSLCSPSPSPTTNPSTTQSRRPRPRPRPTDNSLRSSLLFLQLAALQTRNIDAALVEEALVCLQHRARSLANSRRDRGMRGEWGRVVDAFVGGCLRRVEVGRGGVWRRVGEEVTARDEREEHEEEEEVDEAPFDHDADADADAESNVEPVDVQPVTPRASSSSSSSTSPSPPTTTPSPSHPLINTLTLRLLAGIYTELRDRSGAYQVALWLRDRHRQRTAAAPPPPYSHAEWSSLSEARQAVALLGRGLRLRLASQARSEKALLEGPRRIEEDSRQDEEEVAGTEEVRRGDAWERERPARRARATRGRQEQPQQEVRDDRNAVGNVDVDVDADAELDRWAEEEQHTRDKPWWKRERWDV